ncbi:hypothetical protein COW95_01165 [Candidatus Peregrinibacteria bacterium CG22_combo_CG10-13_8_21_14_all_49_11]|nr:MAG: hypothetical protein COW95_01165 [Candidatus Peregrinibacteria bacterium CG22_combo_CG10-13_8_21_14_all_49_11]
MTPILPLLRCPQTGSPLSQDGHTLHCEEGHTYPVENGIPLLLTPTKSLEEEETRKKMQKFYETVTFPGYDDIDSPSVLMDKAERSGFGKWVDESIPPMSTVLEVGCGTGQMTNFLGLMSIRTVVGVDQSIPSLTLGQNFKKQFDLQNVHFVQGNIFAMPIKSESVDVLICSGVLHHTPDPKGGYKELLTLVKPGGHILIGLYNTYARIPLGIRQCIFKCTGSLFRFLDAHMRRKDVGQDKKEIWFADQYKNPHESWHSWDEVLRWFNETHVEFLSCVPGASGNLFEKHPRGSKVGHIMKQLGWMWSIGREGGLFVLVGKKQ